MVLGFKPQFVTPIQEGIKIHTIRDDKNGRWKPGIKIHGATGVRSKYYKQFFGNKCKSVQSIKMEIIDGFLFVWVDDRLLNRMEERMLAINDGFQDLKAFTRWFFPNPDVRKYEGKIIHWTDFRY